MSPSPTSPSDSRRTPPRPKSEFILGIDPGTAATGWGLIRREGNRLRAVSCGTWRTKARDPLPQRLVQLAQALDEFLENHHPDGIAIEQAFLGKNIQSTMRLGEARGALMLTCAKRNIPIWEYPTATVKKSVVGNGRADKTQVRYMLVKLLNMTTAPESLDASDALGLAFTLASEWNYAVAQAARK
ncbi:MAG: crossover junction endodeoxyribonuclease RuvC [Planctomycetota bacterium]